MTEVPVNQSFDPCFDCEIQACLPEERAAAQEVASRVLEIASRRKTSVGSLEVGDAWKEGGVTLRVAKAAYDCARRHDMEICREKLPELPEDAILF